MCLGCAAGELDADVKPAAAAKRGASALQRFEYAQPHMGTIFKIVLYAPDKATAKRASDAAFARIVQLNAILSQMEYVLKKANSPELEPWITRIDVFGVPFKNNEAQRLRSEYIRLYQFQESWIPTIKSGSFGRFELYDLEKDPGQQTDLSAQLPEVFTRLKKELLEINASVMADGPDWD